MPVDDGLKEAEDDDEEEEMGSDCDGCDDDDDELDAACTDELEAGLASSGLPPLPLLAPPTE